MTPEDFAVALAGRLRAKGVAVNPADTEAFTSAHRSGIAETPDPDVWAEQFSVWLAQRQRFVRAHARHRVITPAAAIVFGLTVGVPSLILGVSGFYDCARHGLGFPPFEAIGLGGLGLLGVCVAACLTFLAFYPLATPGRNSHSAFTDNEDE